MAGLSNRTPIAVGDFDGDGLADVLWRANGGTALAFQCTVQGGAFGPTLNGVVGGVGAPKSRSNQPGVTKHR